MQLLNIFNITKNDLKAPKKPVKIRTKQSVYDKVKGQNQGLIDTQDIVIALSQHFSNLKVVINNCYLFSEKYESDFVVLYDSGYLHEIEIKKTKSDFNEDFHKKEKHSMLQESFSDKKDNMKLANRFSYACPIGMLDMSDIPEYAGWIEVDAEGNCKVKKDAPLLHKGNVYSKLKDKIFRKLAWRYRMLLQGNYSMVWQDEEKKNLED